MPFTSSNVIGRNGGSLLAVFDRSCVTATTSSNPPDSFSASVAVMDAKQYHSKYGQFII